MGRTGRTSKTGGTKGTKGTEDAVMVGKGTDGTNETNGGKNAGADQAEAGEAQGSGDGTSLEEKREQLEERRRRKVALILLEQAQDEWRCVKEGWIEVAAVMGTLAPSGKYLAASEVVDQLDKFMGRAEAAHDAVLESVNVWRWRLKGMAQGGMAADEGELRAACRYCGMDYDAAMERARDMVREPKSWGGGEDV